MLKLLKLAAEYSASHSNDKRLFLLGAVGVRNDGRIVHARNDAVRDTLSRDKQSTFNIYKRFPDSHAEVRLTRKLGFNATIYVARVTKGTHELAMSRPCEVCMGVLKAFRVKKAYYTISPEEYGVFDFSTGEDTFYGKR
jgi:tRNA(Arg) A34 adenosine deaminase TadA